MNRERKFYRQRYYDSKVSQLKECKPSAWWKEVKKLSGMSSAVRDSDELMRSLQHVSEESLSTSIGSGQSDQRYFPLPKARLYTVIC